MHLKAGNDRYVENLSSTKKRHYHHQLWLKSTNPMPLFWGVQMRVPVELIFDQGLGDLFVIRLLVMLLHPAKLVQLSLLLKNLGHDWWVVLGHSHCCCCDRLCLKLLINPDQYYSPNLQSIVDRIRPSVLNLHEIATASGDDVDMDEID